MIALIRAFTKTIFAKLLFALLIVAMGLFALPGAVSGTFSTAVITAGSRETSPQVFTRIFDNYREGQSQRLGRPITNEELIAAGIHRRMAEDLATENSFLSWLEGARVRPGDTLLAERVAQIPDFFNPITNAFDPAAFQAALGRAGLTKAAFDQEIRDSIATLHFNSAMAMGLRAPRIYGALQTAYQFERRDVTWFAVTPAMVGLPAPPTAAQLTAFVNENKDRFRRPEFRQLTLVRFSPANYSRTVVIPEADIRTIYEARKAQLARAERRTFVQVTTRDPRAAPNIAAALRAGQDPAAIARAAGGQAITFTDKPQTSVPDAAVAQAAFTLPAGQVSNPIRGPLAISVVKVISVAPGHEVSFEEARPDIERAMKAEKASERVFSAVEKFEQLRAGGANLMDAARQVGAEVIALPPIAKTGQLPNGQPLGVPGPVLDAAFALAPNGESDSVEDAGEGRYFALRLDRIIPSALPSVTAEREGLARAWMVREIDKRMKARATQLAERIRKGESVAAVATASGAQLQTTAGLEREGNPAFGPALLSEIFLRKPGEPFNAAMARPNPAMPLAPYAVGRVDRVQIPPPVIAARAAEARRPAISEGLIREMAELAQVYARNKAKPKIRTERIDALVGATAPGQGPAGKAPAGKKK